MRADSPSVDGSSEANVNRYGKHLRRFSSVCAPACWHGSSSLPSASSRGGNGKINDWKAICAAAQRRLRELLVLLKARKQQFLTEPLNKDESRWTNGGDGPGTSGGGQKRRS